MSSKLEYYVNGVKQTFLRRVYPTKTFKVVALAALGTTLAAVEGKITWRAAAATIATGTAVILIRAAISKVELGLAAQNPEVPQVVAKAKQ